MLSLVTGLPGSAKTLYTLSKLIHIFKDRQVYIYNIEGVDHDFFGSENLDEPEKWYELPAGAVIIMDEAQKVFPLRMAGSKVPRKCSEFEEHRHKGLDIFLLTQDATLLDIHVRKLAGKHYHIKRLFGTESSTIYEYDGYEQKPLDRNTIRKCIASPTWMFDKKIYDHYVSSEMHTVKRKIPKKLLLVPVVLCAALFAGYYAITSVASLFVGDKALAKEFMDKGEVRVQEKGEKKVVVVNDLAAWLASRKPLVNGLPWTAPMFAEVQEVVTFPKPHCVIYGMKDSSDKGQCQCYSQQVTKIRHVNNSICRQLASEGWFDYTKDESLRDKDRAQREPSAERTMDSREPNRKPSKNTGVTGTEGAPFTNWTPPKQTLLKKRITGRD